VETVEYFRRGILDLDGYRKIMTLGVDALSELGESHSQMEKMWKIVKRWENAIILQAVRHSVIGVCRDLADLLGLVTSWTRRRAYSCRRYRGCAGNQNRRRMLRRAH